MDNSSVFQSMLKKAIRSEPSAFTNFDRTKNVQDQLQEMIQDNVQPYLNSVHQIWYEFAEYDGDGSIFATPDYLKHINSMEQLWLTFVMKERYGKIWNGSEWVNMEVAVG